MVVARRNLSRQLHALAELQISLLQRTFEINVLNRFAQIGRGVDDGDEAVFDRVLNLGAVFDVFGENAGGGNVEGFAAVEEKC